ncbi:MAG: anaerobic ribonucleoside-triphosphate reductase activating protein [Peptoniphilaceae bacterium]|nr:anaerobic ribonucleoside-triphosphate reductase activating protein [Peptoniphilaceae bacterium]MDD7383893.1 anaerobic ribonucleoside-triphosphate reductase activating protein [Peptoniphilaceae bacterium]MDY3738034.1 anaerobic ribonucleoside-triphosphate reductase activating protein [Peptoniphilaceae bacterium]
MRFGQIRKYDVANGPGIRTSFFVTGCKFNCKGCFNKEYQDFNYGEIWTDEQTNIIIENLKLDEIEGLTILGGEPFENCDDLYEIVKKIRKFSDKSIWIYSGNKFEILLNNKKYKKLLELCDVLVDGLFIENLKNLKLSFRGSKNQRIIDIKRSIELNKPVWINKYKDELK